MMSAELTPEPETLRLARQYHALGWSVVPVSPGGKLPAVKWTTYQDNPADLQQLAHWFSSGGYGIGLVQGAIAGSVVLDFDGETGHETRARLEAEYGELPHTVEALTPGGGCHVFLKHPGRHVPTRKNLRPGMDVRGDGGFVVACPSIHANSRRYEWDCDHHPEETQLAECPAWVAQLICEEAPSGASSSDTAVVHTLHSGPLGLPQAVVTDGRETYMRDTVLAVLGEQCRLLHRVPTEDELFDAVWPQYSRKVDFTRPGRGPTEVRAKCRYALARQAKGVLPSIVVPAADTPHDSETGEILAPLTATPFLPSDIAALPPREWVYGHFLIRRFLAVLGAPGGAGKTAYAMTIALSVALNRAILEETVRQQGAVWLFNLEDPRDELMRRFAAAIKHHQINPAELEGRLFVDSGRDHPLVVASVDRDGTIIRAPIVEELVTELIRRGITLLIVDPFVKSHRLEENRNEHIDFAASLWSQVAERANCAILLLHHFRKGGISGEAASFRGASALIDAARAAVSLATMSEEEADRLGVEPAERRLMVRADNAKLNLAPPPEETIWFRLVPVDLGNGDILKGTPSDSVQAFERWNAPSPWDGLSMSMVVRILDKLNEGPGDGEQYTLSRRGAGNKRWAGQVVVDIGCKTDGQAVQILSQWEADKAIQAVTYRSPATRKDTQGLLVDLETLSKMRQQVAASDHE